MSENEENLPSYSKVLIKKKENMTENHGPFLQDFHNQFLVAILRLHSDQICIKQT